MTQKTKTTSELIFGEEVYKIIGAAIEVHRELGPGFLESVYEEALQIESQRRNIPHKAQFKIRIRYKDIQLNRFFIADFIAYERILLELKSTSQLTAIDEAQLLNYLKATSMPVGLLINFGSKGKLEWRRYINPNRSSKFCFA